MGLTVFLWVVGLLRFGFCDEWIRKNDTEFQRYDGWYNNYGHIKYGSVRSHLIYLVPAQFGDEVYLPKVDNRPEAGLVSAEIFRQNASLSTGPDISNKRTAFFAFFGQAVSGEILSTVSSGRIACPIERMKLKLYREEEDCPGPTEQSKGLHCNASKGSPAPFFRAPYDIETGFHFNNPRRTFNWVTSWIDGSFIYSTDTWWANSLRRFQGGKMGVTDNEPGRNPNRVPILNPPPPTSHPHLEEEERLHLVGSFKSNQEPPLLAVSHVMQRLHNHFAKKFNNEAKKAGVELSDDALFNLARRWVIAVWQNLIAYEYVPALLGTSNKDRLKEYEGYKMEVDPSISAEFQGAAFRFGHSLVPPDFHVITEDCNRTVIPLCSVWWNAQESVEKHGIESILRGTIVQSAESGDHLFPKMLRENLFGGLRRPQMDLAAVNVLRGRDLGLADYNSVREALGLDRVTQWKDINPDLYASDRKLFERAEQLYGNSMDNIDSYVGGLLESKGGFPGETFKLIIIDQFERIRDGDRFWFENTRNGLFTEEEINDLKQSYKSKDILLLTTKLDTELVMDSAFTFRGGRANSGCQIPSAVGHTPEKCPELHIYDFMEGSKISFVLAFGLLALFPITVEYDGPKSLKNVQIKLGPGPLLRVLDQDGSIVRKIEIGPLDFAEIRISFSGNDTAILFHIPKGYDLILFFPSMEYRREFMHYFQAFLQACDKTVINNYLPFDEFLSSAVTHASRKKTLQTFFHTAFDQVFRAKQRTSNVALKWPRYGLSLRKEGKAAHGGLFHIELNTGEFAEALQLKVDSTFVKQMFAMADKDGNGFISYQEFVDLLVILSKGTFETKMRMLFDIYDLDGSGDLSQEEFYTMIRSLIEITNRNVSDDTLARIISAMFQDCGLKEKNQLNFQDFFSLVEKNQTVVWNSAVMEQSWGLTKNERSFADISQIGSSGVVVMKEDELSAKSWMSYSCRQMENNWPQILYVTLYLLIAALLFLQYFFKYAYFMEHKSLRQIVGLGASVSRGSAMALSFTLALLMLCVSRHLLSWLRDLPIAHYIPVDSSITFHRFLAYMALIFSGAHIIGHGINFYHISTQPPPVIRCVLPEVYVPTYELLKFHYWLFQTVPGITGVLLVIVSAIMYVFATQWARRHIYASFRLTHNLYPVFFILLFLHGSRRFLQVQH